MRRMSTGKRVTGWALVAAIGVVGSYTWTAYAGSLEEEQQAAGVIVTKSKELAKVQAEGKALTATAAVGPLSAFTNLAQDRVATMAEVLSICSPEVRAEYLGSLQFKNGKLAGAYIGGIDKCLSGRQIDALFEHQGVRPTEFLKAYRCSGRGNCKKSESDACTSNCRE